jgi:hypothetical protein
MADKSKAQLNKNGDHRGMSPKSRENLAKGHKPNKRASAEFSITAALKGMANEPCPERWLEPEDKEKGLTWRQAVAKRIWIEAARGNTKVYSELLDRLEGKVTQPVGGDIDSPIILKVIYDDSNKGIHDTPAES